MLNKQKILRCPDFSCFAMFILKQCFFSTQPYICTIVLNLSKILAFEMHLIVLHTAFWLTELIPARIKHHYGNMKEILSLLCYEQDKHFAEKTMFLCLNSSSHKPWHVKGGSWAAQKWCCWGGVNSWNGCAGGQPALCSSSAPLFLGQCLNTIAIICAKIFGFVI